MTRTLRIMAVASLIAAASPALASGANKSCAGLIGRTDGGGYVAWIIKISGANWWAHYFAGARPCG